MFKTYTVIFTALLMFFGQGLNMAQAKVSKEELTKEFAKTYAQIAYLNYQDSSTTAAQMEEKIEDFLSDPTPDALSAAKEAWKASRIPYGQTEIFRFADGPIDGKNDKGEDGPEGRINSWPLNEAYIDYVKDNPKAGIVQDLIDWRILSQVVRYFRRTCYDPRFCDARAHARCRRKIRRVIWRPLRAKSARYRAFSAQTLETVMTWRCPMRALGMTYR